MSWKHKHLLGLEGLSREDIELILGDRQIFQGTLSCDIKKVPALRGKTVVTLFFEPSTLCVFPFVSNPYEKMRQYTSYGGSRNRRSGAT